MFSRNDIHAAATRARDEYLKHNQSSAIVVHVIADAVARMVLDNAATLVERDAPEMGDLIDELTAMKDEFHT